MRARIIFTDTARHNLEAQSAYCWYFKANLVRTEGNDQVDTFYTLFLHASNEGLDRSEGYGLLLDECHTDAQAQRKAIEIFDDFVNELICKEAAIKGASDCAGSDLDEEHEVMTAAEIASDPRL